MRRLLALIPGKVALKTPPEDIHKLIQQKIKDNQGEDQKKQSKQIRKNEVKEQSDSAASTHYETNDWKKPSLIIFIVGILLLLGVNQLVAGYKMDKPQQNIASQKYSIDPKDALSITLPSQESPQPEVKQVDNPPVQNENDNQIIKHDGSRTGPIVDYYELCSGKTIKIYENERIPYRRINGELVYSTKDDIKCYENQIAQLRQANSGQTNNSGQPSVPCILSDGTYYVSGSTTDEAIKKCQGIQQSSKRLDETLKNSQANTANPPSTSTNTIDPGMQEYFNQDYQNYLRQQQHQANIQPNQSCKAQASQSFNSQSQNILGSYGAGTGQAMIDSVLKPQYQQALANCDSQYPIN